MKSKSLKITVNQNSVRHIAGIGFAGETVLDIFKRLAKKYRVTDLVEMQLLSDGF